MYSIIIMFCYSGHCINPITISSLKNWSFTKISKSSNKTFCKNTSQVSTSRLTFKVIVFQDISKQFAWKFAPSWFSINYRLVLVALRIFSKEFLIVCPFFFQRNHYPNFEKLSKTTKRYL